MVSICKDPDVQRMDEAGSLGLGDCLDVGGDRGGKVKVDTHISGSDNKMQGRALLAWEKWH